MRRLLPLALLCACGRNAPAPHAGEPAWIAANFVGDPPAALMRSRDGLLRWVGLWGTRRLQHASLVGRVAVSPDGAWIASSCWDGNVRLWESRTGREIRTLRMGQEVLALAFSPDGRRVYAGDLLGTIAVWDVATGIGLASWQLHAELWGLALSPDGKVLAFWGKNGFDLRDASTFDFLGREWAQAVQWREPVRWVAFTPDGARVVTCGTDNLVRVWEVATGGMTSLAGPDENEPWFRCVAVDPKGHEVAAAWKGRTILRWELKTSTPLPPLEDEESDPPGAIAYSPGGRLVASTSGHVVRLWDRATGKRVRELTHASVTDVVFAPDGSWLVSGGETGAVRVWDAATGEERLGEERLPEVTGLAVSGDGTWAVTALFTEVRVWDTATGTSRPRVARGDETTGPVTITHEGKVESVWTRHFEDEHGGFLFERSTVLWEPATGETLRTSRFEERSKDLPVTLQKDETVGDVAVSPDGSRIAGAGKDGTVRLWDEGGREVSVFRGHAAEVKCVAWSDDGRWIFSGGEDAFVRVWDAARGAEADLIEVDGRPEVLVSRKDRLYVGCANRTVCVYEWKPPRG